MAKKAAAEPEPAPARETSSLAEALRNALFELGREADKTEVRDWVKRKHPTMEYKESTFNSSLSSIRKKLRSEAAAAVDPTVPELKRVKSLAEEQGGVDNVIALLDKIDSLARRVGGLPRLRQCLHGLKDLAK
jgi:hypothetical protein